MLSTRLKRTALVLAAVVCALALAGLAAAPVAVAAEKCANKFFKEVSKEAELSNVECYKKKFDGVDSLWYKVTVKNLSKEEQRFKVNIFLDSGKAVGGLIPRKTNKGLVKPGQSMSFAYPVKGQADLPAETTIFVKTMSK